MRFVASFIIGLLSLAAAYPVLAQAPVASLALSSDRIGEIKTAQGITTMIRFADPVQEIICGDLYDAGTGKGTFVVQRSGTSEHPGNEVFVKPVAPRGASNMFVKTEGKHTYSFDLTITGTAQAHRMVNVTDVAPTSTTTSPPPGTESRPADPEKSNPDFERLKADAEQQARQKAAEIIRTAQQQADRKTAEAEAKLAESERIASQRADQEIERRFMQALMLGMRENKVSNTRATTKKVVVSVDSRILIFDEKAYLRYTMQNAGDKDFTFTALTLEVSDATETGKPLTVLVNQSKPENILAQGESLTGVIVFDPKQVGTKQKLTLFVRGEDSADLAHLTIQQ